MTKTEQSAGKGGAAATALAPVSVREKLVAELSQTTTPEQFCSVISRHFGVRNAEVALLRLDKGLLTFIYPRELQTAGSIPVSSSSAVAVHTVLTKKVELFNNFVKVKHVSVFETVKIAPAEENVNTELSPIQKLMSAPVVDSDHNVLGIIQVSRKAVDLKSAGRDFTLDDLQQLEAAAKVASKSLFAPNPAKNK